MNKLDLLDQTKYRISEDGSIWSISKNREMKFTIGADGYLASFFLCTDNILRYFKVHRVIAYFFCDREEEFANIPFEELDVEHKNTIKTDNRAENLRWCTRKGNMKNPITRKRMSESAKKKVYQYTLDDILVRTYESTIETQEYGFVQANVSACCRGIRKTHKGYKWSFEPL